MVAKFLGFMRKIVGSALTAVANKTWSEREKIPLRPGGQSHILCVNAQFLNDYGEFLIKAIFKSAYVFSISFADLATRWPFRKTADEM